jgi:hypothetical protein
LEPAPSSPGGGEAVSCAGAAAGRPGLARARGVSCAAAGRLDGLVEQQLAGATRPTSARGTAGTLAAGVTGEERPRSRFAVAAVGTAAAIQQVSDTATVKAKSD